MKVIAVFLTLALASVAREPTRARAAIYSRVPEAYVGTFVFDRVNSTEILSVTAHEVNLKPREYVVVAYKLKDLRCESIWSNGWKPLTNLLSNDVERTGSFRMFTMEVREDRSRVIRNVSTLATLSLNGTNSIVDGAIAIYEASKFTDDQSTPTTGLVACGAVELDGFSSLLFARGPPRSIAGSLRFTSSSGMNRMTMNGTLHDFPPGTYAMFLLLGGVHFVDCDSLTIPEGSSLFDPDLLVDVDLNGIVDIHDVTLASGYFKLYHPKSIFGQLVVFYDRSTMYDSFKDRPAVACGLIDYV